MSARPKNPTTDATTPMLTDTERNHSRRIARGGRIVVLPPNGHGNMWAGGARR